MKRIIQIFQIILFLITNKINASLVSLTGKKIGKNLHIIGNCEILNIKNLIIGNDCCINNGVYINAHNPIVIGNDVTLSAYSRIISTGIDIKKWMHGNRVHTSGDSNANIMIGDHVWIGAGATILEDVTIAGPYVIVAAGAVVTKSIDEPYCLVAGVPAKIIKRYEH